MEEPKQLKRERGEAGMEIVCRLTKIAVAASVFLSASALLGSTASADPTPAAAGVQYPSPGNVPAGNCDPEKIDFTPFSQIMRVGESSTFTVDACLNADVGMVVRLVEVDPAKDDTLESVANISVFEESVRITFYLECVDGGLLPNKLVGHDSYSQEGTNKLSIETDYAGLGGEWENSDDNVQPNTGQATVWCLDEGETAPAGGIAQLPDIAGASDPPYATIAGGLAAAALTLTAGAWYARRRWGR